MIPGWCLLASCVKICWNRVSRGLSKGKELRGKSSSCLPATVTPEPSIQFPRSSTFPTFKHFPCSFPRPVCLPAVWLGGGSSILYSANFQFSTLSGCVIFCLFICCLPPEAGEASSLGQTFQFGEYVSIWKKMPLRLSVFFLNHKGLL